MTMTARAKAARAKTAFGKQEQALVGYQEIAKAAQRDRDQAQADAAAARAEAKDATARLAGLRGDIDALKGELALAYANIERQAGYLDRVREDDSIKEGATRDVTECHTRVEPMRRGPALYMGPAMAEAPHGGRSYAGDAVVRSRPFWAR